MKENMTSTVNKGVQIRSLYIILGIMFLALNVTHAATIQWDGGAGTNNFSDAANWDSNTVPGSDDYAYIGIAATVDFSGSLTIERFRLDHASASFTIMAGASLTVDGTTSDGFRVDEGVVTNNGTLMIQNIGNGGSDNCIDLRSTFHNNGTILINGSTDDGVVAFDGAIFNNNTGASLTIDGAGDFGFYIDGGATSTVNNDGTITINSAPDDAVRLENGILNNTSNGIIDINTPADLGMSILEGGDCNNSGTIDISGSTARYGIETFDNGSGATFDNLSTGIINISSTTLDGLYVGANTTFNNDGSVIVNDAGTNDINREAGSTYVNTSNAIYAPGSSPGTLTIAGDFEFGGSTYTADINGTTPDTEHDVIDITGAATLTGSNLVVDWGSFVPSSGESYTILSAANVSGLFSSFTIPAVAGLSFNIVYGANTVSIDAVTILPIDLIEFNVNQDQDRVRLDWETGTEVNNRGFEVQRSADGKSWEAIDRVDGYGNSSVNRTYLYIDKSPFIGDNYYRLKQEDYDGGYDYTDIKHVSFNALADTDYSVFPNPSPSGRVTIELSNSNFESIPYKIYSADGNLIQTGLISDNRAVVELSHLPAGLYYLKLQDSQFTKTIILN